MELMPRYSRAPKAKPLSDAVLINDPQEQFAFDGECEGLCGV